MWCIHRTILEYTKGINIVLPKTTGEWISIVENNDGIFLILHWTDDVSSKKHWCIDLFVRVKNDDFPYEYAERTSDENAVPEIKASLIEMAKKEMKQRGVI